MKGAFDEVGLTKEKVVHWQSAFPGEPGDITCAAPIEIFFIFV
jgi:hypothetical protein